jgi:hypothetical protein
MEVRLTWYMAYIHAYIYTDLHTDSDKYANWATPADLFSGNFSLRGFRFSPYFSLKFGREFGHVL